MVVRTFLVCFGSILAAEVLWEEVKHGTDKTVEF